MFLLPNNWTENWKLINSISGWYFTKYEPNMEKRRMYWFQFVNHKVIWHSQHAGIHSFVMPFSPSVLFHGACIQNNEWGRGEIWTDFAQRNTSRTWSMVNCQSWKQWDEKYNEEVMEQHEAISHILSNILCILNRNRSKQNEILTLTLTLCRYTHQYITE